MAAVVTLAVDPAIGADVGWQLSFAAVLGILALASPLRAAIVARIGGRGWRGALAEGAAVTIAATLATAPLIAFHFEAISTTTLVANLLALPAVAPAMWLGMLDRRCRPGARLPGWDSQRDRRAAARLHRPGRRLVRSAELGVPARRAGPDRPGRVLSGLGVVAIGVPALLRRRRLAAPQARPSSRRRAENQTGTTEFGPSAGGSELVWRPGSWFVSGLAWAGRGGAGAFVPIGGLRVSVLDVGQGDAILLQPAGAPAVLVDGGPPGDDLAAKLRAAGVGRLGVAVVTHEQSDHAGGIEELLGRFPLVRLAYARLSRRLRGEAEAAGAETVRIAEGAALRSGRLRLEVLWPPRELLATPLAGADPNTQALVLLVRWGDFSMLLTADAEAEAVPLDPGPVDVLKVAHHGSEDAGLDALLDRIVPRLAVISVGAGNSYGHPTPATLATLAAHGVRTLRTDRDGTIVLDVGRHSVAVERGRLSRPQQIASAILGFLAVCALADRHNGRWLDEMLSKIRQSGRERRAIAWPATACSCGFAMPRSRWSRRSPRSGSA